MAVLARSAGRSLAVGIVRARGSFALTSLQQDFAAYWVAGAARRAGLDPYVNYAAAGAPGPWDGVAPFATAASSTRRWRPSCFGRWRRCPIASPKLLFTGGASSPAVGSRASPRWSRAGTPRRSRRVMLGAGALFFPLYLHLERGQIDLLLLPLLVLGAWRRSGRPSRRASRSRPPRRSSRRCWGAARDGGAGPLALGGGDGRARRGARRRDGGRLGAGADARIRDVVLPRAALYGEGGTRSDAAARTDLEGPATADDGDTSFRFRVGRTSGRRGTVRFPGRRCRRACHACSRPTLPHRRDRLRPYLVGSRRAGRRPAALVVAARRRARATTRSESLFVAAAVVACVVTSPTGWVMGFVWALPIAPLVAELRRTRRLGPRATMRVRAAWIACALVGAAGGLAGAGRHGAGGRERRGRRASRWPRGAP